MSRNRKLLWRINILTELLIFVNESCNLTESYMHQHDSLIGMWSTCSYWLSCCSGHLQICGHHWFMCIIWAAGEFNKTDTYCKHSSCLHCIIWTWLHFPYKVFIMNFLVMNCEASLILCWRKCSLYFLNTWGAYWCSAVYSDMWFSTTTVKCHTGGTTPVFNHSSAAPFTADLGN